MAKGGLMVTGFTKKSYYGKHVESNREVEVNDKKVTKPVNKIEKKKKTNEKISEWEKAYQAFLQELENNNESIG